MSSGKRVVSPRDDMAAYFTGQRLDAQIRGLNQSVLNMNQAIGMIQTADAGLSAQMELVQRMRELAVQAANGTLSDSDRANIELEVQSLLSEYNRITTSTSFGDRRLLDGSFDTTKIQVGPNSGNTIDLSIDSSAASAVFLQRTTIGTGILSSSANVPTGAGPRSLIYTDLNQDGIRDFVSADISNSTLSIMLGTSSSTFQARTTLATGTNAISVVSLDANEDGKADLAVAESNGGLSLFLGNGNGTFQTRVTLGVGGNPQKVVMTDFNSDGFDDLMTVDQTSTQISVLLGNGNGTFEARKIMSTGATPRSGEVADLNNDGAIDILATDGGNSTVTMYLGNGNGTFQARTTLATGTNPWAIDTADMNNDGKLDLLVSEVGNTRFSVFLGNGNGTFQAPTTMISGSTLAILPIDINSDGVMDVLDGSLVGVWIGNGNGTFQTRTTFNSLSAFALVAADFNDDGVTDIASSDNSNNITLWLNRTALRDSIEVSASTQEKAQNMISVMDSALASLSSMRADLGAIHSRLEAASSLALLTSENLTEAKSKSTDVEYALEISELVRNQILQQAQVAVLAQANLQMQLVLGLLLRDDR